MKSLLNIKTGTRFCGCYYGLWITIQFISYFTFLKMAKWLFETGVLKPISVHLCTLFSIIIVYNLLIHVLWIIINVWNDWN